MKKLLFIVGLALTSLTVSAQLVQEEVGLPAGLFTLEWKFNPFDYESKPVKVAQLNGRMFLNDKSAVRLGVGVGFDRDTDDNSTSSNNTAGANPVTTATKVTNDALTLRFSLGYEYHFANMGHLDFYGGLEGGYLGRFYSATRDYSQTRTEVETTSSITYCDYKKTEYNKRSSNDDKQNENGIFASVFTGIDYYIYKKLYIGAELGLTFNTGKKKNGSYTEVEGYRQSINGNIVDEKVVKKYSSETGITTYYDGTTTQGPVTETKGTYTKIYIEPAIRIGWMF